jgi:ceramide glucosyltransferase
MTPLFSWHAAAIAGRIIAGAICLSAAAYYLYALYAARRFFARPSSASGAGRHRRFHPPITVLKPIRGLDREAYENFASFCRQSYPRYQVIFGAAAEDEPAIEIARRVARDFPDADVQVVVGGAPPAANPKVGNLWAMLPHARHAILLISDSDIRVEPTHLQSIVRPLADTRVGVVTCLYRSHAAGFPGTLDALGLTTEFQPSVLVARELEGISFAMGSGILIRREALERAGGFEAIADFLADDYLLGNLPAQAGYLVELSDCVVEHRLGTSSFEELVAHQVRWNRGIRASRPWGYAGLALTQGVPAALLLLAFSRGPAAIALAGATLALRLATAWFVAVRCLRDRVARRSLWLVPLRDLLSCALWLAAFFGDSVVWRGARYRLGKGGRLLPQSAAPVREEAVVAPSSAVS